MSTKNFSTLNRINRIKFLYLIYFFNFKETKEKYQYLHENIYYHFTREEENFILKILEEQENLEKKIIIYLPKTWTWERIGFLEKAILLNALAEILITKTKKAIIINEAIVFAKNYCDSKAFKLINAILDNF